MSEEVKEDGLVQVGDRRIYPEVAEYLRVQREGQKTHDDQLAELDYAYNKLARQTRYDWEATHTQAWDGYNHQRGNGMLAPDYTAYMNDRSAAESAYLDAREAVSAALKNSSHPEVAWIAEHSLSDYPDYSLAVLKALPVADTTVLWEIKRQYSMCDVFDRLFAAADAEGVFNGGKKMPGTRELAALRSWITRNWGGSYARDVTQHMAPFLKAVREDTERQLAEAELRHAAEKAQWQGLDEAWRSERSRSNAATRRANLTESGETSSTGETLAEGQGVTTAKSDSKANETVVRIADPFDDDCDTCVSEPERIHMHEEVNA